MALSDADRQAIRAEIRACSIFAPDRPALPLPQDLAAERRIVAALLEAVPWRQLAPLDAKWFCDHKYKTVVAHIETIQVDGNVDLTRAEQCLFIDGALGPMFDWLEIVRDCTVFRGIESTRTDVALVRELYERRELIAKLTKLEAELRIGARGAREAIDTLRGWQTDE